MNSEFEIEIISPPDREFLTVSIMISHEQWAELDQEDGVLSFEFYSRRDGQPWRLKCDDAIEALLKAKQRLLGTRPPTAQ
jgi:hypothetical protein